MLPGDALAEGEQVIFDYVTVDGIIYGSTAVLPCSLASRIGVVLSPFANSAFNHPEAGFYCMPPRFRASVDHQVEHRMSNIPNLLLAQFGSQHRFDVHVFFPAMMLSPNLEENIKRVSLSRGDQLAFVNEVFLVVAAKSFSVYCQQTVNFGASC